MSVCFKLLYYKVYMSSCDTKTSVSVESFRVGKHERSLEFQTF